MAESNSDSNSNTNNQHKPHLSPEQLEQANNVNVNTNPESNGSNGRLSRRPSTPNASSAPIRQASIDYTGGRVNCHPSDWENAAFKVGVSEDRNRKCRRTMEDSHAFIYDYGGVRGQGYFAVFDGHAGKHAAEWCGQNFHKYLLQHLSSNGGLDTSSENTSKGPAPIPDLLNQTFHIVDAELSKLAAKGGTHSGCTAVTAFLRLEDENGNAVELEEGGNARGDKPIVGSATATGGAAAAATTDGDDDDEESKKKGSHRERFKSLFSSSTSTTSTSTSNTATAQEGAPDFPTAQVQDREAPPLAPRNVAKRTLYTANVGDARAVLSRGGKAVRLTYDHKGSDVQEAQRIKDAGGFVMNNRVNGVLAVTRSLGDASMKEFVVGSPYTTETSIGKEDAWLIIACDGLWDVCEDQMAVDLIKDLKDPQDASRVLLEHALQNFSTDNLSVLVVSLQE